MCVCVCVHMKSVYPLYCIGAHVHTWITSAFQLRVIPKSFCFTFRSKDKRIIISKDWNGSRDKNCEKQMGKLQYPRCSQHKIIFMHFDFTWSTTHTQKKYNAIHILFFFIFSFPTRRKRLTIWTSLCQVNGHAFDCIKRHQKNNPIYRNWYVDGTNEWKC